MTDGQNSRMDKDQKLGSSFVLQGQFLGFAARPGDCKFKYLRLSSETGEWLIKVEKELRLSLWKTLPAGAWVEVSGQQKPCLKMGGMKLKAYSVSPIPAPQPDGKDWTLRQPQPIPPEKRSTASETILVCQKSDCCRRGGQRVLEALRQGIEERGLGDRITVRGTGCMKQCKSGPHVVMPDKSRHQHVRVHEVADLIETHLGATV